MLRFPVLLILLLSALALGAGSASSQECEEGCGVKQLPACSYRNSCSVQAVQDIRVTYRYGWSVSIDCDADPGTGSPPCPDPADVGIKVTVLKSVAKVLHSGTTISAGAVSSRRGKDINVPDPNQNYDPQALYYFVKLKPAVVKRMKAINVSTLEPTVSGTVDRGDGTTGKIPSELVLTAFQGNCSGRTLHIQRRLTYGGHCVPR